MTRRAVFLDRDGTLNKGVIMDGRLYPPPTLAEFSLLDGVEEAVHRLKAVPFRLVVVTNQPDVATGRQERAVVEAMHDRLRELLPVEDIRVCYHTDADGCDCRKPKPGMLRAAAEALGLDLASSYMIGDRWRDVGAGRAAGCRTIYLRNGYDEPPAVDYDLAVESLIEASAAILAGRV